VAARSGALGLIVSFFLPGVGSMINGSVGTGVAILVGFAISWILSFVFIGIPFLIGFWIWGLVDGYQSAQRWNAAHGIIS
jgi:TM2 domain-containing membrane protein YozV